MRLTNLPVRRISLILSAALIAGSFTFYDDFHSPNTLLAASPPAASVPVNEGLLIYEQNCISCHAIDGKGLEKYPPLASDHVRKKLGTLSLIHISEPTRRTPISYAVFCLKKKK